MTGPAAILRRAHQYWVLRREPPLVELARRFEGAIALEPGGPSPLFSAGGAVPVYPALAALDTLDFASETLWSESQTVGGEVRLRRRLLAEAGGMDGVAAGTYDLLLASHVLEHLADPLGSLAAWKRVVKPGGHLLLVLPHRDATFDHHRPTTSLAHLRADAEAGVGEDDLTHLEEVLRLHDLERDPGAPSREVFEQRCRENLRTRGMHHHVFTSRSVFEVCAAADLQVLALAPRRPHDIVCLCAASRGQEPAMGERELSGALRRSPFASDRAAA